MSRLPAGPRPTVREAFARADRSRHRQPVGEDHRERRTPRPLSAPTCRSAGPSGFSRAGSRGSRTCSAVTASKAVHPRRSPPAAGPRSFIPVPVPGTLNRHSTRRRGPCRRRAVSAVRMPSPPPLETGIRYGASPFSATRFGGQHGGTRPGAADARHHRAPLRSGRGCRRCPFRLRPSRQGRRSPPACRGPAPSFPERRGSRFPSGIARPPPGGQARAPLPARRPVRRPGAVRTDRGTGGDGPDPVEGHPVVQHALRRWPQRRRGGAVDPHRGPDEEALAVQRQALVRDPDPPARSVRWSPRTGNMRSAGSRPPTMAPRPGCHRPCRKARLRAGRGRRGAGAAEHRPERGLECLAQEREGPAFEAIAERLSAGVAQAPGETARAEGPRIPRRRKDRLRKLVRDILRDPVVPARVRRLVRP